MSSKDIKYERVVTNAELKPLCKALNNFLANIEGDGSTFNVDSLKKIEISIKRQPEDYKLKVKLAQIETANETSGNESACKETEVKENSDDENSGNDDDESEEKPGGMYDNKQNYKELKKRMDKDFDIIKKSVKNKKLPAVETVKRFVEDSGKMCRFRGKGEKYYAVYLSECGEFKKAFKAGDLTGFEFHTRKLNDLKKSCHKKYK